MFDCSSSVSVHTNDLLVDGCMGIGAVCCVGALVGGGYDEFEMLLEFTVFVGIVFWSC